MVRISQAARNEVRRRLLESAARQFAERGFEAANIDQVAVAAGVAKGTIYNYFRSKEELFGEVLTEAARRAVDRYAARPHGSSTRADLTALAAADVAVLREQEAFMRVLVGEAMSPRSENYALILEHLAPFLESVSEILERGVTTDEVRRDRPVPQLALFFVGTLTLLYIEHWRSGGGWPALEEIPDLAVTMFLDGARGDRTPTRTDRGRAKR